MAQLISVRLSRHDSQALGFRLQGGKDFGTPLVIQKVNGGSPAERAGLLAGDAVIKVNNTDVYSLRHKEAQDAIIAAGQNIELTIQRGGGTWRPSVTNIGTLPTPSGRSYGQVSPVTKTSLRATPQPSQAFGTGHNNVAKPFNYMNGSGDSTVKSIVNRQYNTPVGMYSEETIAETLSAQAEVLAGGVLGVNFKKNEKHYDSEKSEVFKMLQEADNDPEPEAPRSPAPMSGLRHVVAPTTRPDAPINNTGGLPPESSHFYSRASVARCASPRPSSRSRQLSTPRPPPPAPEMSCAGTQTPVRELVPEPVHRPSLAVGCHRALPGGDIQLGAPALPAVAEQLPQVEDTPYCSECNRYIIGVFVRIKDKNLHVECFKCATCGTSLKNQGYYNLNGKLYCDIHAKLIARQNPPAPNLEPVTLSPGGKFPASAITSALANHTTPLPPLSTNNIGNGLSPYSPPSQIQINTSRDQTDEVPGLRMENVEAFNTLLKSESMESSKMVANVQKDLSNLTVNTNGHSNEFATANDGNSAIPNNFRKVIPPHLGGQYKLSSNLSGPRPFGGPGAPQSTPSMASTLSPRSAPMSPAHRPVPPPAPPTSYPVHAPVTPVQISTNKPLLNGLTPTPAKSDTMRKITKFALDNNYEIGIQRKIKPGDHIANMANKIKDTIIMKHPLNNSINDVPVSGASGSPKSSMNSSPSHSRQGSSEKNGTPKQWIPSGGIPPPPPPPPTFTPDAGYKITFDNKPNGGLHKVVASPGTNGKHSSSSSMSSGTLSPPNDSKINGHSIQAHQLTNILLNKLALQKENKIEDKKVTNGHYNKPEERTRTNGHEHKENGLNGNGVHANSKIIMEIKDNIKNKDVLDKSPVRMREKRTDNANGTSGKRDSKVVSRPISTIASLDFAEGVYPICNKCDKQISRGPFITALGRIWCPDHFICVNSNCRRPLQDIGFVEEQGQLYCEYCFEQFIAPACDKCHSKIKGDCLNAIGKHFHPECFNCAYCGKLFGNNPFFLEEGLPYCEADWNELFTTKCFACGFPVEAGDRWVEALNNNYHSQCFNCTMCKKNLEGQSFYAKGGRPFCKNHAR